MIMLTARIEGTASPDLTCDGLEDGLFGEQAVAHGAGGLVEKVYRHVVEGIRSGQFSPRSRLTQRGLARQLQLNQVTVREGLERLAQHGWIERNRNRSARVRSFSGQDRQEVYAIREMIEATAVKQLAQIVTDEQLGRLKEAVELLDSACANNDVRLYEKADRWFHRLLVRFAGNRRVCEYHDMIERQICCFLTLGASSASVLWAESSAVLEPANHSRIYGAVAARDPDLAERLIRKHIRLASELFEVIHRNREP
jgi:DNA-binding GntR family transcriptional regulator